MLFINDLHKPSIHTLRKTLMRFNLRAQTCNISCNHVRNDSNCMRVTHIHHINGQLLIVRQSNVIQSFWCIRNKWNFLWQELWITHIHAYPAILTEFGFHNPCLGLHFNLGLCRELTLMYKACKAAHAITTLFNFRTISIKNTVFEIDIG